MSDLKNASSDTLESNGGDIKSFQDRLLDMPTYVITVDNLYSSYNMLKGRNSYTKRAFYLGEFLADYLKSIVMPAVVTATDAALTLIKPVMGEDPKASVDACASEFLAKVQEKVPIVKQYPGEIADMAKSSIKEKANYFLEKILAIPENTAGKLFNVVVISSDIVVEICFPTDCTNADDLKEIEKSRGDKDKGFLIRAGNLRKKAFRRGYRKLMTFKSLRATVNMALNAQKCLLKNRYSSFSTPEIVNRDSEGLVSNQSVQVLSLLQGDVDGRNLIAESWDSIYEVSMYIPRTTLEITGEVYISAKEMIFAYSNAHSLIEMPHAVVEIAESYYNTLRQDGLSTSEIKKKAIAFAYVPAQVVSNYIQSSRVVQWILPSEQNGSQHIENTDVLHELFLINSS